MHNKIPAGAAPSRSANDNGPLTSAQVKALKIAIAIMGAMIVAALIAIVARVIYLSVAKKAVGSPPVAIATELAPKHLLALPSGAIVKSLSLQENRLLVHYETARGPGAMVLDLSTGRTVSEISITTGAPTGQ